MEDLAGCFSNRRKPLDTLIRRVLKGSKRPASRPAREPLVDERGPVAEDSEQSQTRLNASNRAERLEGYQAGVAVKELAQRFGVHRSTVREMAARAGIEPQRSGLTTQDEHRAAELYAQGMTLKQVAAQFGVVVGSVRGQWWPVAGRSALVGAHHRM